MADMFPTSFIASLPLNYGYAKPDSTKPWQRPINDLIVQSVRNELKQIMKYWLDKGADGFRIDMAASLVRNDPDGSGLRELWQSYRRWLDESYPEAILISEWCSPRQAIDAGFDIDFLIHFGESAYNVLLGTPWGADSHADKSHHPPVFFDREGKGDIQRFLKSYLPHYQETKSRGYISLPTGNHDFPRQRIGRDERDLRVIQAMLFTMPGVPFIYYGDEIGMRYLENLPSKEGSYKNRTGSRTPMQWDRSRNAGFSQAAAKLLYLPVDGTSDAPSAADQESNPDSLLNHARRLLKLRADHKALGNTGDFKPIYAVKNRYPFVYERSSGTQRFWIAINPADQKISISLPQVKNIEVMNAQDCAIIRSGKSSKLTMGPVSFGIFKVE
ncbi:MAG: alpha-amylase family glycosyl hydrolase [Pirellulales bacterium]